MLEQELAGEKELALEQELAREQEQQDVLFQSELEMVQGEGLSDWENFRLA